MSLKKYDSLPDFMKSPEVKEYYDILVNRRAQLILKRAFDLIGGAIGTIVLLPIMGILAIVIKCESEGPALFKQVRVTQYGREFKILKFRTMVVNAEKLGTQVTSKNDPRVTKVGRFLRKYRLDELPQIINILKGELSFVGTRPEVPKFVNRYTNEMIATLLLLYLSIKFCFSFSYLLKRSYIIYCYLTLLCRTAVQGCSYLSRNMHVSHNHQVL